MTKSVYSLLKELSPKKEPVLEGKDDDKDPGDEKKYQAFFNKMLKKFDVKSVEELKGDKKKEFFAAVDKGWNADDEAGEDGLTEDSKIDSKILMQIIRKLKEKNVKKLGDKEITAALKGTTVAKGLTRLALKAVKSGELTMKDLKEDVKLSSLLNVIIEDEQEDDGDNKDDTGSQKEYKKFFDKMLKKFGVKSVDDLEDDQKKKFFAAVEKGWNSEDEAGKDGVKEEIVSEDAAPAQKKAFVGYAIQIIHNIKELHPKTAASGIETTLTSAMNYLGLPDNNPLKLKYYDFFPASFDKHLFTNDPATNDKSPWNMLSKDDKHEIIMIAMKQSDIHESFNLLQKVYEDETDNKKEVGTKDKPVKLIKKKDKDANIKIGDREDQKEEEELTIEFPEGVYIEMDFDEDVNNDLVKMKAQKLYQAGSDIVEIAVELAKEFKALDWSISDISTLGNADDDNEDGEVKESLSSLLSLVIIEDGNDKKEIDKAEKEMKTIIKKTYNGVIPNNMVGVIFKAGNKISWNFSPKKSKVGDVIKSMHSGDADSIILRIVKK